MSLNKFTNFFKTGDTSTQNPWVGEFFQLSETETRFLGVSRDPVFAGGQNSGLEAKITPKREGRCFTDRFLKGENLKSQESHGVGVFGFLDFLHGFVCFVSR